MGRALIRSGRIAVAVAVVAIAPAGAHVTGPGPLQRSATEIALVASVDPIAAVIRPVSLADVRYTWRPGCPVGPAGLRKVEMTYRTYDGRLRRGVLIVRSTQATAVAAVFRAAFRNGFRINRMDNPNVWRGDDEAMMAADNTSAFNCRRVTGNPSRLSPHSYGTAIDVNPRRNPYRAANGRWYPPNGIRWVNRSLRDRGMLFAWSTLTRQIVSRGGIWGGYWPNPDYQHYELR
ncbi:M15 family metallopeptidase [Intrasporangium mesophilum]